MSELFVELVLLALLVTANGIFAMAEMAIVSSRQARLQRLAEAGDEGAAVALELSRHPDHFLSTVQIGITLVGILAGAFGGASMAEEFAAGLQAVPILAPYAKPLALGLVVALITYASLVFGELVPKRLALANPEAIAAFMARPMRGLAALAGPAVRILGFSSSLVMKFLPVDLERDPPVTEEEVKILVDQGTKAGVFDALEQQLVDSVFRLGDRRISALMTPRRDIVWIPADAGEEEILRCLAENPLERFPVCREDLDDIVGILSARSYLAGRQHRPPASLEACLEPPLYMPESTRAIKALQLLGSARRHLAMIIDEYGSVEGMITLSDILEAVVGEVADSSPDEDPYALQREDGSWLLDGALPIDDLTAILDADDAAQELRGRFQTLAGFVLARFGHMPHASEHFTWAGWRFEVMDTDGRRVDKVLIAREPAPPDPDLLS